MGLDINAYSGIKKLDVLYDEGGEAVDPVTRESAEGVALYANQYFGPDRWADLEERGFYSYEKHMHFNAGSYGTYNVWREQLAKLAGYTAVLYESIPGYAPSARMSHQMGAFEVKDGPFLDLVCFSDCEGFLGPVASTKLAKYFAEYDARAKELDDMWFYEYYKEWRKAFELAENNGAVKFS